MSKKRKVLTLIMLAVCSLCFLFGASCGIEEKQEEHEHIFTNYVSNNDATCSQDGTKTAKCEQCSETDTVADVGSKKAHTFTTYTSDNNATCEADGTKTAKCELCNELNTVVDEGTKKSHEFTNYVSNNDATCIADGTKTAKCNNCSATDTKADIGSMGKHVFTNYVSNQDATCSQDGTKTAKCEYCSAKDTKADVGSKKQHSFVSYSSNGDATCEADGTKTAKCEHCSETDTVTDVGSKKAHTFNTYISDGNATCEDDGTKTAKCEYCSATDTVTDKDTKLNHNYGKPTYTWSADNKTCTAETVCLNDASHVIKETVDSTIEVTQARASGKDELSKATATFTNQLFSEQVKEDIVTDLYDRLANTEEMKNVTYAKSSSADGIMTVHPGGEFSYSITINNANKTDIFVNVSDELPEKTTLVSGCKDVSDSKLTWSKQKVSASSSSTITYTVKNTYKVSDISSSRKTGVKLKTTNAKVMDSTVAYDKTIYVQETFNQVDIERIEMGIQALSDVDREFITSFDLVRKIYQVGFTKDFVITKDAVGILDDIYLYAGKSASGSLTSDRVKKANNIFYSLIPSIYGGTEVASSKDSSFRGTRATTISKENFVSGDIFIAEENGNCSYYIVYRNRFIDISDNVSEFDLTTDCFNVILSKLSTYTRYAGIRLSTILDSTFSYEKGAKFNDNDDNLTEAQKAVVKTAWSYVLRGSRVQYNDNATSYPFGGNGFLREAVGFFQPEWSTVDDINYTNCSMFCFDVYWSALNFRVQAKTSEGGSKSDLVRNLIPAAQIKSNNITALFMTQNDMSKLTVAQIKEQVCSTLSPGDIIIINRKSGACHALLYVGNGYILNATGASYSIANKLEQVEAAIRIETIDDMFHDTTSYDSYSHYIPVLANFAILRPLNNYTGNSNPENTNNRINNLNNICAEKLCSIPVSNTVNCGDLITYTFNIRNYDTNSRTITINDVIPDNTEFVSATGNYTYSSGSISWEFVAESDEKTSVSYTVRVKNVQDIITSSTYKKVNQSNESLATVNGVTMKTHGLLISNTLTSSEQQTLLSAIDSVKNTITESADGVEVANAIYYEAFGITNAMGTDSVYNYLPIYDGFEIDDTKIGMQASGNVGDTVSFVSSTKYSVSKGFSFVDANGRLKCLVKSTKLACEVVAVDSSEKIVEKKTISTSNTTTIYQNFNTSGTKNAVVKIYVNYAIGKADKFGLYYYDSTKERASNDEALFVRFTSGSYETRTSLSLFCLNTIGKPALMVAPSMFGGLGVGPIETSKADIQARFTNHRLFMYDEKDFIIGDVVYLADYSYGTVTPSLYMYIGNNKLISLMGNNLYEEVNASNIIVEGFYVRRFYAVLRPSMQNNI